jgi:hypothetical protein
MWFVMVDRRVASLWTEGALHVSQQPSYSNDEIDLTHNIKGRSITKCFRGGRNCALCM